MCCSRLRADVMVQSYCAWLLGMTSTNTVPADACAQVVRRHCVRFGSFHSERFITFPPFGSEFDGLAHKESLGIVNPQPRSEATETTFRPRMCR